MTFARTGPLFEPKEPMGMADAVMSGVTEMEPTEQNNTENGTKNTEVKRAMLNAVRSEMIFGDVKIYRRFYGVDEEKNTDPNATPFERIEVSVRQKIGSKYWVVCGDIEQSDNKTVYNTVFVGREEMIFNHKTQKDETDPFALDMVGPHALVSYNQITLYRNNTFVDKSDVISVYGLARLFDLKISVAEKLMENVKKFYIYGNRIEQIKE